jgi:CarboxypepD_reg-like domain
MAFCAVLVCRKNLVTPILASKSLAKYIIKQCTKFLRHVIQLIRITMMRYLIICMLLGVMTPVLLAQPTATTMPAPAATTPAPATPANTTVAPQSIQFSGLLVTDDGKGMIPVPYATVFLPDKRRGTYSDHRGFFTMVVHKGDKVQFNYLGLQSRTVTIPDTLTQDRYSVVQFLPQDSFTLPTTVIFAWPSREHFKIEFLKMDVTPELQRIAATNLANEYLADARKNEEIVPFAGPESGNFYLRQQAREYTYIGQTPPMNIFSPIAWAQFFRDWKDGKFKKKD